MSNNLNSLLQRVAKADAALAADLQAAMDGLAKRREFGLNFEKHRPERVDLHGRRVRVGDKVRFLAPRGTSETVRSDVWRVLAVTGTGDGAKAELKLDEGDETAIRLVDDLVVVADFRDPIYPGLVSTGSVERGGGKPFHAIVNAENYHALEAMLFTSKNQVDVIYIDPPYNTGAKDWKYNNDYVDGEDSFRHSKWLSFMERRLKLAKKLLNPDDSVLIVTIDEKEYLRLGLLLEQTFSGARIQMVSIAINPAAVARGSEFRRADEYAFFVMQGAAAPTAVPLGEDWVTSKGRTHRGEIRWDLLRRSAESSARTDRPGMFYPFFVTPAGTILSIGDAIPLSTSRDAVVAPDGAVAAWPMRKNGSEGRWRLGPASAREAMANGYIKVGAFKGETTPIYYLTSGEQAKIADGIYQVTGLASDGSITTDTLEAGSRRVIPSTQWRVAAHDSTQYGSRLLLDLLPDRRFPFPKSLYAVEDCLRFFVTNKPDALVVDFFGGSGTTTHAVARLNRQDGGRRRSILITNNEVSAAEQSALRKQGARPGDSDWESLGICEHITKPRIRAAFTGQDRAGHALKGEYKFVDEFPMEEGFDENVEFFDLTYQDAQLVELDMAFAAIAPLLWMRAGSQGRRINEPTSTFDIADTYAVLFRVDAAAGFLAACAKTPGLRTAFIVTDDEKQFQMVAGTLPPGVEPVRLYESYLRTFEINTGKE